MSFKVGIHEAAAAPAAATHQRESNGRGECKLVMLKPYGRKRGFPLAQKGHVSF